MGFLPTGFPYGGTPLGGGVPNTSSMTSTQYLDYLEQLANTPQGIAANNAAQQTIAMNVRIANEQLRAERDRIAIARGQAEADRWYKGEQLKLAQQAHQLAVQTQQQNYELAVGGLTGSFNGNPTLAALGQQGQMTGMYNGQPTLANLGQQAQYTGLYNGTPTLQAIGQQQQFGLQQGALTGNYQGNPTLQALQNEQNFGINQAGVTGLYNGSPTLAAQNQGFQQGVQAAGLTGQYQGAPTLAAQNQQQQYGLQLGQFGLNQAGVYGYGPNGAPTLANQQFQTGATGYLNGNPTLAREQAAAGTALQAAQLGASLQGPGNWAQYLTAANAVAGSPASSLLASAPGGLGQMQGDPGGPMTLAKLLGDFGVMPGTGPSQPMQPQPPMYDLRAGFSEPWAGMGGPPVQQNDGGVIDGRVLGASSTPAPMGGSRGAMMRDPVTGAWSQQAGAGQGPGEMAYAGGSPTFNEHTGTYSAAPAGGMRPSIEPRRPMYLDPTMPQAGADGGPPPGYTYHEGKLVPSAPAGPPAGYTYHGGQLVPIQQSAPAPATQQPAAFNYNPYSLTGAIGQAATAARPTNAQLGLSDADATTLKGYFQNPGQAPSTWWSSKSPTQKSYLSGLMSHFGEDPETFKWREANSRPRQSSPFAAVA